MTRYVALPRRFYEPSAKAVAPALLGHLLLRKTPEGWCGGVIVEAEAYLRNDAAAHSFRGETPRNRIMFGPPGYAYVYFIYGNHWCFNTVCRQKGIAEAVLVRAIEPTVGLEWMQGRRPLLNPLQLTNGPGKLCAAMHIDSSLEGADLCDVKSAVFIARNPNRRTFLNRNGPIITGVRIGITKAASLPLRFYLGANQYVSRRIKRPVALVPPAGRR
jgi:DNA-3-methyladenine glycosylase